MKKGIIFTVLITFLPLLFYAQVGIGGGFNYVLHSKGFQLRADLPVSNAFAIEPLVSFYTHVANFNDERYNDLNIGADAHYSFNIKENLTIYPLGGVYYHINWYYSKLKFSLGVGSMYSFTKKMKVYVETKYLHHEEAIGFDVGFLFVINK